MEAASPQSFELEQIHSHELSMPEHASSAEQDNCNVICDEEQEATGNESKPMPVGTGTTAGVGSTGTGTGEGEEHNVYSFARLGRRIHTWHMWMRRGYTRRNGAEVTIIALSCIFCMTGFAVLCAYLVGPSLNSCQRFLKDFSNKKRTFASDLDPVEMDDCLSRQCQFNYDQCDYQCPFGFVTNQENGCTINCQCAIEGRFQGDVTFRISQVESMLKEFGHKDSEEFSLALTQYSKLWKSHHASGRCKVPYSLDQSLSHQQYLILERVLKDISSKTCIDMVPRASENDYISIVNSGSGCESYVGRIGGAQEMRLAARCFSESAIQKEIMHALGFYHENSREDRDAYVIIYKDKILPYQRHNFVKLSKGYRSLNSEYDLKSIMHFSSFVFAIDLHKPTIVGKSAKIIDHHNEQSHISERDWQEINIMYSCSNGNSSEKAGEWNSWRKWSSCSETCGDGQRIRYRNCVHKPTGEKLTRGCTGRGVEFEACVVKSCPSRNGIWNPWNSWTDCRVTCGKGTQHRTRLCSTGNDCVGYSFEYKACDLPACNTSEVSVVTKVGTWSHWGNWSRCDGHCDEGRQFRTRSCELNNLQVSAARCALVAGLPLVDKTGRLQLQYCTPEGCPVAQAAATRFRSPAMIHPRQYSNWYNWYSWSSCDRTCGEGIRRRNRYCSGFYCPGQKEMTESCNAGPCLASGQIFSTTHGRTEHFCIYGTVYAGKMNIDSIPDLLCMYPDGYLEVFLLRQSGKKLQIRSSPDWEGQTGNCNFVKGSDNTELFVKDVSGDGLDDIICYNAITKNVEVTLNEGDGTFRSEVSWKDTKETCELVAVEDVNGDGKPDLVCREEEQGMFTYLNVR